MKCICKCRSIFVLLAMGLAMISFSVCAEDGNTVRSERMNTDAERVLMDLRILDGAAEETVTRADFVHSVIGLLNFDAADYREPLPFSDIELGTISYGEIGILYQMGVLSANSAFFPAEPIAEDEAVKILVSALGYDREAQERGGYPVGYKDVAVGLRLAKSLNNDGKLSYAESVLLLYRALNAKIRTVFAGSANRAGTTTVLENYHHLRVIEEQITATGRTGLLSEEGKTREDCIKLGTEIYTFSEELSGGAALQEYLGYRIKAYIADDNILMTYETGKNSVVKILGSDVESAQNYQIQTEKKKYALAKEYQIIYNGIADSGFEESDFTFEDSEITLISSNNNNLYDIVHLWKPEYVITDSFALDGSIVTDKNRNTYGTESKPVLCLNDSGVDYEFVASVEGREEKCSLRDLRNYPTLAVWVSRTGSFIKVKAFQNICVGTLNAVREDEVAIGEQKLKLSAYAKKVKRDYKPGTENTFYLTEDNKVLGASAESLDTMKYGYLLRVQKDIFDTYQAYILDANGEKSMYTLSSRVIIDKEGYSAGNAYESGKLRNYQLIRYAASADKVIKRIDTASEEGLWEKNVDPDDSLRLYYKEELNWYSAGNLLAPYVQPQRAVMFTVPTRLKDPATAETYTFRAKDFYISNTLSQYGYEKKVDAYVYDMSDDGDCGAIIEFSDSNPDESLTVLSSDSRTGVIDDVSETVNADGEIVRQVDIYTGGKFERYMFSSLLDETFDKEGRTISPGDIVRMEMMGNIITNLMVEFYCDEWKMNAEVEQQYRHGNYGSNAIVYYHIGNLYSVNNENVCIRDFEDDKIRIVRNSDAILMKYNKNTGLKPVSREELIGECNSSKTLSDKAVAITRYAVSTSLLIFYDAD